MTTAPATTPATATAAPTATEAPATSVPTSSARAGYGPGWPRRAARDLAYLLTGLPVALVTGTVLIVGVGITTGLTSSLVAAVFAVAALFGTLACARAFAGLERSRLAWVAPRLEPPVRRSWSEGAPGDGARAFAARALAWLRDPQQWLDLLHGFLALPVSLFTWTVTVAWTGTAVGGLTEAVWRRWLPGSSVHVPFSSHPLTGAVVGAVLLLTLVPVLRGLALVHAGLGRALLGSQRVRALEERVVVLTRTRRAAAEAEAQSLATLERDLHDGPQQRLVRLDMDLSAAQRRLASGDHDAASDLLGSARTQAVEALGELRALSRGIASPVLADRGLAAALAPLAARCPVAATVEVTLDGAVAPAGRLPHAVERAAYFIVAECLANTAKHSGAATVRVQVSTTGAATGGAGGHQVVVRVEDDGVGGAHAGGHGLSGLQARCEALDGHLSVRSPAGGPTVVTAHLPLAADAAGRDGTA